MSYSAGQFSLIKIYLGAFSRAPELYGFDYWSKLLAASNITNVANTIFALPTVQQIYPVSSLSFGNRDFVSAIYRNVFGKAGDTEGLNFWTSRLDVGIGRGAVVLEMIDVGLGLPASTSGQAYVANRYWAARYAIDRQMQDQSNISTANLKNEMDSVTADSATLTPYANNVTLLSTLASQLGNITYGSTTLYESSTNEGSVTGSILITLSGDNFKGNIGATLGTITNLPQGLQATLTKTSAVTATLSITGQATSHASSNSVRNLTIEFKAADFLSADISKISGALRSDLSIIFYDLPANVTGNKLSSGGVMSGALVVDLTLDRLTLNGSNLALTSGDILSAVNVDFSVMSKPSSSSSSSSSSSASATTVAFTGDSAVNTYQASAIGDSIRGAGGNDVLIGGAGSDKYIFEATPGANGYDRIENFLVGASGDVLNVSAFTKKTLTTQAAAVKLSTSTAAATWANGDVVVIQGYNSSGGALNETDLLGVFGAGKVLAAPTNASKLVMVTCGVEGNATVWFVTNAGNPAAIEAGEIVPVATLIGVNNLEVLPMNAANFA